MKIKLNQLNTFLFFTLILSISNIGFTQEANREFYQIKIYSFDTDDQIANTENYLKEAYLPAIKRLGISNVGVFKPRTDSIKKIYVLIPFSSLEQFEGLENKVESDKTYLKNGSDYIMGSHEKPNFQRIESIILKAFIDMPKMKASSLKGNRKDRVYELRSYESPTVAYYRNKVDMFNAGGEVKLFNRLEFNAVFYGEVISGSKMPNLMYMTTFTDQESRDAHWKEFVDSPEWKKLAPMSKYANNVSHIDKYFLYPTEYSDY